MFQSFKDDILCLAANWRLHSVAAWLINHGANVNASDRLRNTPLLLAVKNLDKEMVCLLLKANADANLKDAWNLPPLTWAFVEGAQKKDSVRHHTSLEIMKSLISAGAKTNDPASPIATAIKMDDVASVELLVKHGADWHLKLEGDGRSATEVLKQEGSELMRQKFSNYCK